MEGTSSSESSSSIGADFSEAISTRGVSTHRRGAPSSCDGKPRRPIPAGEAADEEITTTPSGEKMTNSKEGKPSKKHRIDPPAVKTLQKPKEQTCKVDGPLVPPSGSQPAAEQTVAEKPPQTDKRPHKAEKRKKKPTDLYEKPPVRRDALGRRDARREGDREAAPRNTTQRPRSTRKGIRTKRNRPRHRPIKAQRNEKRQTGRNENAPIHRDRRSLFRPRYLTRKRPN